MAGGRFCVNEQALFPKHGPTGLPPVSEGPDVLTVGEAMGCLRASGALQSGSKVRTSIAGAESNVAIGLARLGHATRWCGAVGADAFGALILRTLRAEGVDISAVRETTLPTGFIVFTERLPTITTVDYFRAGSAGASLTTVDVDVAFAHPPKILHLTGITPALSMEAQRAVEHAIKRARDCGSRICLDINFRSRLWSRETARAALAPLAAHADIIIASEDELDLALELPPHNVDDQISALLEHASDVVIKRGADGASGYTREHSIDHAAIRVPTVDSIGAGDAFAAGYLSASLDGLDLCGRLTRGGTLGAFAVATRGDWEGLPFRSELGLLDLASGAAVR